MINITNKFLIPLDDNAVLWRYMDFKKFKSLLTRKSLFFCRADCFIDKFEGSIPRKEYEYRERKSKETIDGFITEHKKFRKSSVVSCWNIGEDESTLMWALYSKDKGIAIKTNKERLYESLENSNEQIWPSKVRYINYNNGKWNGSDYPHSYNFTTPIVHKRIEYKGEKEFRLIIHNETSDIDYWNKQTNKNGTLVDVDISKLVEKIILAPNIKKCMKNRIEKLADSVGILVEESKLTSAPIF